MTEHPAAYQTLHEIETQAAAWQDALKELDRQHERIDQFTRATAPEQLIFVGCGSPYFLARTAASIARALTGLDAQAHPGSDLWLFPDETLTLNRETLMTVISRSGETTEVLRAIERYRARGGSALAAVTCYEHTSLAREVETTLYARAGQEIGLAQTRSFTSMLILTQGLVHALAGRPLRAAFRELPSRGEALIREYRDFAHQFGGSMRFQRVFFLGGGPLYGLACEAMLKMKEMSISSAEAYHMMEFRHGPMALIDRDSLVVGLVSEAASAYEAAVLAEMRQKGATVLAVTPAALPAGSADHVVALGPGLTDVERGPLYLPVLHQLIYAYTVAKGLNPDLPNNLTAVINLDGVHQHKPL